MTEKYRFRKTNAEKINDVLYDVWDPIGVRKYGGPRDEYENYVSKIQTALEEGVNEDAIFRHLREIEHEAMGLRDCYESQTHAAAKALVSLFLPPGAAVAFDS